MFVVARLPESLASLSLIRVAGLLFERRDEANQVASRRISVGKEMKMIGHGAEGDQAKVMSRRGRDERGKHRFAESEVAKDGLAVMAADGDKVGGHAQIVFCREPGGPVFGIHNIVKYIIVNSLGKTEKKEPP